MRIIFNRLRLKQEIDQTHLLHWGHFSFVLISLMVELTNGLIGWFVIPKLLIFAALYRLFFRTIKELYYTFWTFSIFLQLYFLLGMYQAGFEHGVTGLFYTNFLASILLGVEMYILFSPIYYPQVSWWEFDFRYRHDLKITANINSEKEDSFEGRLTDLRRDAGCLSFFKDLSVGDYLDMETTGDGQKISLRAEIVSKRQYSLGRPKDYGVRFHFDDVEEKKEFAAICRVWKSERKFRLMKKFEVSKES